MPEEIDEGMQFLYDRIATFEGSGVCRNCGKKIGLLTTKKVYTRFGFFHYFCKDCYRKYTQTVNTAISKQK